MSPSDKARFIALITQVLSFYRQDMSEFAVGVWWEACKGFDIEQFRKAMTAHAMDPEHGQFAPKPADLVRLLQGTQTDRSLMAWGKVLDAIKAVGAYQDVVFDDPAIHAAIEDLGGWVAVCRSETDELSHLQRRFCQSHKAYAARPGAEYPALLRGESNQQNLLNGKRCAPPIFVGNAAMAQRVMLAGGNGKSKTQFTPAGQVLALTAKAGA